MKRALALILLLSMFLSLIGCGNINSKDNTSEVKSLLCSGVYYHEYTFDSTNIPGLGPGVGTKSYNIKMYGFNNDGTYRKVEYKDDSFWGTSSSTTDGKYQIDVQNGQIVLTDDKGNSQNIPYQIDAYSHKLLFNVKNGLTDYKHASSMDELRKTK